MPTSAEVPETVRRSVSRALALHNESPLPGTYGLKTAEALASGTVSEAVLYRMARFFTLTPECVTCEDTDPVSRSFLLHGAEAGKELCRDYMVEGSPLEDLFGSTAEEVQERLSQDAWIYEYDLNPTSAGKFVVEYFKRTGSALSLAECFGPFASEVEREAFRVYGIKDPVLESIELMDGTDIDYIDSAAEDLDDLTDVETSAILNESLPWATLGTLNKQAAAKMVWPGFIAYFILAVEAPVLLKSVHRGKVVPPATFDAALKNWHQYSDAVNVGVMYFHKQGVHYVDPDSDEKFEGIDAEIITSLHSAFRGRRLNGSQVRKMLGKARRWTAKNGMAGSMFHVYIADWNKGNWQHVLDAIPENDDVREAFASFVAQGAKPAHGIKLQQTLSAADAKKAVQQYVISATGESPNYELNQAKMQDTLFGTAAEDAGTPVGVYSLIKLFGVQYVTLCAAKAAGNVWIVCRNKLSGKLLATKDAILATGLDDGEVTVLQAHYEHAGTSYAPKTPDTVSAPKGEPAEPTLGPAHTITVGPSLVNTPVAPAEVPTPAAPVSAPPAPVVIKGVSGKLATFLIDTFGVAAAKFVQVPLHVTTASTAWKELTGKDLLLGTEVKTFATGKVFAARAAFYLPAIEATNDDGETVEVNDTIIVFVLGNDYIFESSDDVAEHISNKLIGPAVEAPKAPEPPKFKPGDVISMTVYSKKQNLYVVDVGPELYWLQSLRLQQTPLVPVSYLHSTVDLYATLVAHPPGSLQSYEHVEGDNFHKVPIPKGWPATEHTQMTYEGKSGWLLGACSSNMSGPSAEFVYPVFGMIAMVPEGSTKAVPYLKTQVLPAATFACAVFPTYTPASSAPEPSMVDSKEPEPEMCGVKSAIEKATKLGWLMAVKSEHASFIWPLGAILKYSDKTRMIIGYAYNASGVPIYIIETENGIVNFKTTAEGNKSYGPQLTTNQTVVNDLKPKPTSGPSLPKLNYKLSKEALELAKHGMIFEPAPKPSAFYVGSKLMNAEGSVFNLIGWTKSDLKMTSDPVAAVLMKKDSTDWMLTTAGILAANYSLTYDYTSTFQPGEGIFQVGKNKNDASIGVIAPGCSLPCALPEGWDSPDPVDTPSFPDLEAGKHASAGIVVVLPPGTNLGDSLGQHVLTDPAVVLTRPLNGFGGYTLTFPKGTLDKGESVIKAAVREVWEETGLSAQPVLCLGMFKGNNSTTCMYLGYATGGDLKKAGKETDAVAIHVLKGFSKSDMTPGALVASLPWAKELVDRDKAILSSAITHLVEYGMPKAVVTNKAENDVQVSQPIDTVGKASYNPSATHSCKQADGTQSLIDYPLSQVAINSTPTLKGGNTSYTLFWTNALPYLNKGYPPPGVKVGIKGADTNSDDTYDVLGYVKTGYGVASTDTPLEGIMVGENGTAHLLLLKTYPPDSFSPVVSQDVAKQTVEIPADSATDEVWEALYKKMPFPMSTALVAALKRSWFNGAVDKNGCQFLPTSIEGMKTATGGLAYATGFTTSSGTKYVAMGFVHLTGKLKSTPWSDSQHFYQLAIGMDGDATAFEIKGSDFTGFTYDASVTDSAKIPDPWYSHPDPLVNGTIQKVYANGGNLEALGVSMKTFKEKWLKEAGIPYYAVASYTIITDIAALFVPGVATKFQCDAVIACLKKRMQLTQKKGKKTLEAGATAPKPTESQPDTVSAPIGVPAPDLTSPEWALTTEVSASASEQFIYGKSVGGGSKPNYIAALPNGTQWFVKPAPSAKEKFRPAIDVAAYKLCAAIVPSIPVAHGMKDGMPASVQPLIAGAVPLSEGDVSGLSDNDKAVVLAQHAADMFIGDHDGHYGNWMRGTNGKLYAIDKGQAFKFLLKGTEESLMPGWTPPGNFGTHLAKELLLNWAKGKATIPESAFAAFYGAILKVVAIPSATLKQILTTMSINAGFSIPVRDKLYADLQDRQIGYSNAWTKVMIHLADMRGEKWKWPEPVNTAAVGGAAPVMPAYEIDQPAAPPVKVEPMVLDKAATDLGFGVREATALAIANQSKWQGMSVQIDKDAIENQEVHVKCVKYSSTETPEQKATLIHFRVGRVKGMAAEAKLNLKAKVVSSNAAGPQPLPFDNSGSGEKYWGIIQAGVKTINHHLYDEKDGKPNPDTIAKVAALIPELKQIREATKNAVGKYNGISNEAANLMATAYVGYCETIVSMAANAAQLIGQKADVMFQFLWQEKKTKEVEVEEDASDIVVKKILKSGFSPSASPMGNEVAVKGTDAPLWNPGGTQSQFMIEVKSVPGARLYYSPPHGEQGYSEIKSYFGQAWAVIPGAPSPAQVATLLKIFEKATGLPMSVASQEDNEFLYLSKQAFLLQDTGDGVEPDKHGEAVKDPTYQNAVGLYSAGKTSEALAAIRSHVAGKFGTTPDKLSEVPGYNLKQKSNVGGGYIRHSRLGWTRSKLVSYLGNVFFAHCVTGKTLTEFFKQLATHNGALLANVVKPYHGIPIGGTGSPSADAMCGGAVNIFGCMRKGFIDQSGVLYFDPSLFLRTDVYVIGSGDSFGNVTATRYTTPESWKQHKLSSSHGSVSTGSQWQFNARHDIDIPTYLHTVILENAGERDAIRKLCMERGWTKFANGRTLEQVVTLRGDATV